MIRILQIVTKMNLGGIENMIMNFYRNIDRSKFQFDFLVQGKEEGYFDKEIISLGGKIFSIHRINFFKPYIYEQEVYDFLIKHPEYEIVHSHLNAFNKLSLKAAKKANVSDRIAHSHTSKIDVNLKNLYKNLIKIGINKYTTQNLACSKEAGEWLYGKKNKFTVLKNAIDINRFIFNEEKRKIIRMQLGINENDIVIGHVGRFFKPKNHKFLIEIFNEFQKLTVNSKLLLVGSGELQDKIVNQINELKLNDKIILAGNRKNIEDYYNAMDLFVFPSLYEGLGMVLIEAQINGLNCLTSKDVVPSEVNITEHVKFVPLNKNAKEWNKILNEMSAIRYDGIEKVKKAGYDVKEEVKLLQKLYLKEV